MASKNNSRLQAWIMLVLLFFCLDIRPSVAQSSSGQTATPIASQSNAARIYVNCGQPQVLPPHLPNATGLIIRSINATRCYNYDLLIANSNVSGLSTYHVNHWVAKQVERSYVQSLDNTSSLRPKMLENELPSLFRLMTGDSSIESLTAHYRFHYVGQQLIANHLANVIDILPNDSFRFAQRLWVDEQTQLPLKRVTIDPFGRVVNTSQVVAIHSLTPYSGLLTLFPLCEGASPHHWVTWLPHGFHMEGNTVVDIQGHEMESRFYSDGLSSLNIFIGPWLSSAALPEGTNILGGASVVIRHFGQPGAGYQAAVTGEVPLPVLIRVADGLNVVEK